jgi:small subunit ribosomal protein S4e
VGLFDVIEFVNGEIYRLVLENKRFALKKIGKEESILRPCRVIGKTLQKKGVIQVNFDNGMNILTNKKDVKTGDTIIIDLEKIKLVKHLKREVGALVIVTEGKYIGQKGTIKEIKGGVIGRKNVKVQIGKELVETTLDYVFVVDPSISHENGKE